MSDRWLTMWNFVLHTFAWQYVSALRLLSTRHRTLKDNFWKLPPIAMCMWRPVSSPTQDQLICDYRWLNWTGMTYTFARTIICTIQKLHAQHKIYCTLSTMKTNYVWAAQDAKLKGKNRSACYTVQNFAAQDNIKDVGSLSCKTEPLDRTCETQPPIYSTVWCVFFLCVCFFVFFSSLPYLIVRFSCTTAEGGGFLLCGYIIFFWAVFLLGKVLSWKSIASHRIACIEPITIVIVRKTLTNDQQIPHTSQVIPQQWKTVRK